MLDVPVLLLEVDVLMVRDVVVNEVLDVLLLEVDMLVVRDVVVNEVLDVLLLEVDVLVVRDVAVNEALDVLLLEVDVLEEEVLDVLDSLVVDVCARSRKTVQGRSLLRSFKMSMQNDFRGLQINWPTNIQRRTVDLDSMYLQTSPLHILDRIHDNAPFKYPTAILLSKVFACIQKCLVSYSC